MNKSTKRPTKAEQARLDAFRHIGCIVSGSPEYDVHHLTEGGRRLGHLHTIPLHPWFHRGIPFDGVSQSDMERSYGPSLAKNKAAFEESFGDEKTLLEQTNERLRTV